MDFLSVGFLQIVSNASPFQSDFDKGGRLYGGSGSSAIIPILPSGSRLRIPPTAASPVIPPPMIKYLKCSICFLSLISSQPPVPSSARQKRWGWISPPGDH